MKSVGAGALLVAALTSVFVDSGRAQSPAGVLILPAGVYRPPVVLLVSAADAPAADLAEALKANGVASLGCPLEDRDGSAPDVEAQVRDVVLHLTTLRNDARFPTVSVVGRAAVAATAAVAARLGRADGFVGMAPQGAAADIARLIVPVLDAPAGEPAGKAIADFVRGVPPLGRIGTREQRPSSARLSPRNVALATIGGALLAIEHGQPQARGRAIWGALVPWNRVWMPGADEATTFSTSIPVLLGDLAVPAGDHTFYLWPADDRVQLIVSRDVGQFHTVYNSWQELGRADMTLARRTDRVEGLTFTLEAREAGGVLKLAWDDREYSLPVTVRPH